MSFIERFHCIKDSFQGPNVSFIESFRCIGYSYHGPNERDSTIFF